MKVATTVLIAGLTTVVSAQFRCQMFVNRPVNNNPIADVPDIGEIRQGCKGIEGAKDIEENPGCITMGTFPVDIKKDIIVSKGTTGLLEDIQIHVFNSNLKEGFIKYRGQDLNWQDFNQCKMTESGSLDFDIRQVQCDFDCP